MRDPVCGMQVENEEFVLEYEANRYVYCSQGCLDKFRSLHKDFSEKHTYDLVIVGGRLLG